VPKPISGRAKDGTVTVDLPPASVAMVALEN
jgi:hypothetical protein